MRRSEVKRGRVRMILKRRAGRISVCHHFYCKGIMASKSFTALPSVVSVYAEKTAVQMRCYSRGFEKVTWPIVAIVIDAVALVCLAVAAGTPMWVELKVLNGTDSRGFINFGLFNGAHRIMYRESPIAESISDSYLLYQKYTSFSLGSLYATFALSAVAMIMCVIIAPLLFLNSYQTVTTWWKGPPMLYILSFIIAALGMIAMGVFMDFYIWDLNSEVVFVDSTALEGDRTSFRYLLDNEGYTLHKILHYSFGLHVAGASLPLLVLLLTWRLTVLLPQKSNPDADPDPMSLSAVNMGISNKQMQYEQEQYFENPPRPQELAPFDENVIMQTPVKRPDTSVEQQSLSEEQDVLY